MNPPLNLLPGVDEAYVRDRLDRAGGGEIENGKFHSPESSAALAVNGLAWFNPAARRCLLPAIPGTEGLGWPASSVDVEAQVRFPWRGGRHPWLDAVVRTERAFIGIESKRREPFRDAKRVDLSPAYDRPVWGDQMRPFEAMRDALRVREPIFKHLDAAQLVKHAFGLVSEFVRHPERRPVLVYLYAEPSDVPAEAIAKHRDEVQRFDQAVRGAAVSFVSARWDSWIDAWSASPEPSVREHGRRVRERFDV